MEKKNIKDSKKKSSVTIEKKTSKDVIKTKEEIKQNKTNNFIKKIIKNKKIIIAVISLVIILLVLLVLITGKTNNDDKTSGKSYNYNKWELVQGKEIKEETSGYDTNDYYMEYFNSTRDGKSNRFWFLVPKDMNVHTIGNFILEYVGPLIITFDDNYYSESFDDFFKAYKSTTIQNLEEATIKKNIISENMMAIDIIVYSEDFGDVEELVIVYRDESDNINSFVRYDIMGDYFSNEFKEKAIKNFKFEENGAKYTSCEEKEDKYECEMVINTINKKINFTIDANKYTVLKNKDITDYTEKVVVDGSNHINLIFSVSDSLSNDLQNLNLFGDFKSSKVKLNGKEYTKYLYTETENPVAYYIIPLDKNLYVLLGLTHPSIDLDEIAKDFIDYKVSNLK